MKITPRVIFGAAVFCGAVLAGSAQELIPGKIYVAEISGGVAYTVGGQQTVLKKGVTLPAEGAMNETAPASHVVYVYSNGTSLYVDEQTVIQIVKFEQVPFPKGMDTTVMEPSVSHTVGRIKKGRIIITTNKLMTGTTMVYITPHAQVKIRGKEVVIEVYDRESRIYVIDGDVTVSPAGDSSGGLGKVLHSGQEAVVTDSSITTSSSQIQVLPLDQSVIKSLASQLAAGERAQKIVVFQTTTGAGGTDVEAVPVVPTNLPVQLTVSPDTLRTGQ
jgi:hypothetical protein